MGYFSFYHFIGRALIFIFLLALTLISYAMKLKSTLTKWSILLIFCQCLTVGTYAHPLAYCTPTFANGCGLWNNQSISLGTLNWTLGTTCTDYDYTNMSATLNAGVAYSMTVTNGNWCGCTIWVDFNQNEVFDASENLYYDYANVSANYTYNFNLTIPNNVPTGSYRMRVIGAWGSDGITVGPNGYGPCGSYQYGNFQDFTVNVIGSVGIPDIKDNASPLVQVSPNPAATSLTVTMKSYKGNDTNIQITDVAGKIVSTLSVTKETEVMDISALSKGIYILHYTEGVHHQDIRIVK